MSRLKRAMRKLKLKRGKARHYRRLLIRHAKLNRKITLVYKSLIKGGKYAICGGQDKL